MTERTPDELAATEETIEVDNDEASEPLENRFPDDEDGLHRESG